MEVLAVVSCVAAVVSAYRDGSRIVLGIKERRMRRRALQPTKFLEESLNRGPIAVEEVKEYGIEKHGTRFSKGDRKCCLCLLRLDLPFLKKPLSRL